MTNPLPPGVAEIGRDLAVEAGSYLRNTVHEAGITCTVCTAPVDSGERCIPCNRHLQTGALLADRVGTAVYAVEPDSQTYLVVRGYKYDRPGPSHELIMQALLAVGLRGHSRCASRMAGLSRTGWAVVPSTRGRAKLHELVSSLAKDPTAGVAIEFCGAERSRELRPADWAVPGDVVVPEHVLVVDDSWVSGSHAQGAAAALKAAGAQQVSVFAVARVLHPEWPANRSFITSRLPQSEFDWSICPWTGGRCP